jgi:hypothetical protein
MAGFSAPHQPSGPQISSFGVPSPAQVTLSPFSSCSTAQGGQAPSKDDSSGSNHLSPAPRLHFCPVSHHQVQNVSSTELMAAAASVMDAILVVQEMHGPLHVWHDSRIAVANAASLADPP